MKPQKINPQETTRAEAFELWMNAPNPMVTFLKIASEKYQQFRKKGRRIVKMQKNLAGSTGYKNVVLLWAGYQKNQELNRL